MTEFKLPGNVSDREKEWSKFYSSVVQDYFHIDDLFISKVKDVLDSGYVLPELVNDDVNKCAYLLQYGICDTCMALEKFHESAAACQNLKKMLSFTQRINICCLGSQALFAVLGVCKVIDEAVQQFGFSTDASTLVQIFIIDKNEAWKSLVECTVDIAKKEYKVLKLKLDFLVRDITKGFSSKVTSRVRIAHITAMVRCMSNLPSKGTVGKITENTLKKMKENSYLFLLDHDTNGHVTTVKKMTAKNNSFCKIKIFGALENYKLHEDTRPFYKSLYQYISPLNLYWNANSIPVSFSTWIKSPEEKVKFVEEKKTSGKEQTVINGRELPETGYRAKRSSNTLRNSKETYRLVGKLATVDMEKKNKDDSNRHTAKYVAVSRYVNFDSEDLF